MTTDADKQFAAQTALTTATRNAIAENPYPHYTFVAQNAEVERQRAERYAYMIVREAFRLASEGNP